ncbi:MAG: ImmA/IrrE family metallo-endopeptidase, partial [Pyrinomonadaceae bacterium]
RDALRGALEIRRRVSASNLQPICIYDTAEQLGIDVIFRPEKSLGGLYNKTAQTILIPTHRPPGRQTFTCAHEIGHWFFGHGTGIDEINDLEGFHENEPKERLVDIFASYLLMPPWAVRDAYKKRGWNVSNCTASQAYTVAGQLGVGYQTLVQHLQLSLNLISSTHAQELLRTTPKKLRCSLLGNNSARHLVIVDNWWGNVAVDLQVGDLAIIPVNVTVEGKSAVSVSDHELGQLIEARQPGISRAESHDESWAVFIRVSRKDFIGRSIYRHLEDPDVDDKTRSDI